MLPAEIMLAIDPLVSISTALASRSWVWSLTWAGIILAVCVIVPRGFCGYLCPLGTLIDLFDWSIAARVKRFQVAGDGWWVHLKYYLLLGTLVSSLGGVLVSGYVAAIPVVTRGLLFIGEPLQSASLRGVHLVALFNWGHLFSIILFLVVLGLGFLRPRFWCKYVCPSGAVFSLGNLLRFSERKVESSCIHCNKCIEVRPFDAIKPDFTTRTTDCTLCQTCGGVCPTHAIKFVERSNRVELKVLNDPPTGETEIGRRGFISAAAGTAAALAAGTTLAKVTTSLGANLDSSTTIRPIRPPGSVPEKQVLQLCIRCGECFKACPNNVLQAVGFKQGLEGLWTPEVNADWVGCESSCNACTQVCPTGAIRALPLEEKRHARIGLAIVNQQTCLPLANREACQLCVDECVAAGYDAIEFKQVHTEADDLGLPVEGTGYLAPVVLPEKCVGCGLCQTRCYGINVLEKGLLAKSAIIIEAGEGREDRLMRGATESRYPKTR
jgi:ferredoxin